MPKMPPKDELQPGPAEIELLKAWIAAGAKGPSGAAPDPTMLVVPEVKLLAPAKEIIHGVALSPAGAVLAVARHGSVELRSLPEGKTLHVLTGIGLMALGSYTHTFGELNYEYLTATGGLVLTFR